MTKAVHALTARINEGSRRESHAALRTLMTMGPKADAAVPTLIRLTTSKSPALRAGASSCLGCIAAPTRRVVASLLLLMRDRYALIRTFAANSIHQLGARTPAVLRGFLRAVRDPGQDLRRVACMVLADFGSAAQPAMPALFRLLRSREWSVRLTAAEAMISIGPKDPRVKSAIRRQLSREPAARMKQRFARLLAHLMPGSRYPVPKP